MMSNKINEQVQKVFTLLQDYRAGIWGIIFILITMGGEELFQKIAFKCPLTQPDARDYSLCLILSSFFIILILSIAANNKLRRVFYGCRGNYKCWPVTKALSISLLPPAAWILILFLDGDYWACMRSSVYDKTSVEYQKYVFDSQFYGWIAFAVLMFLMAFCICFNGVTYRRRKFLDVYRDVEDEIFDKEMKEFAKKSAESNVKSFLETSARSTENWDSIAIPEEDKNTYFSTLDEWAHQLPPKVQNSPPTVQDRTAPTVNHPISQEPTQNTVAL